MSQRFLFLLLVGLSLSLSAAAQTAPTSQGKLNVIISRDSVRFAPQELAVEMRLVVTDQTGAEIHDSGPLSVSTLDWLLLDSKGEAVKGGLYLYTLTIKDAAGETSQRHGYLIVNRTGDADRIYIATGEKVGIGASNEVSRVTVVGSPEATVGGAELPGAERGNYVASGRSLSSLSERAGTQRDAQGRSSTEAGKPSGTQQVRLAPAATPGRLAKFAADGTTPIDTQLSESNGALVVGNAGAIGNIQIFGPANADVFAGMGPDVNIGPAFNYGYAGSSFGRSAGFFNVRPDASAVAPNPSLRFLTANQQRMIITNTGGVGVGTSSPATRLDVVHPGTQIRFGPSAADNGGYLVSTNPTQAIISAGGSWDGANWIAKGNVASLTANQDGLIQFFTNDGLTVGNPFAPAERMRIAANGNVGIGVTNPNAGLDVNRFPNLRLRDFFGGSRTFDLFVSGGFFGVFDATAGSSRLTITPEGHLIQPAQNNGLVKAMIEIDVDGNIIKCYNGITNSTSGNCGFTVTEPLGHVVGVYRINYGFPVASRFVSITCAYKSQGFFNPSFYNGGANYRFFDSTSIEVFTFMADDKDNTRGNGFMIILF